MSVSQNMYKSSNLPQKRSESRKADEQPFISRDKNAVEFVSVDITLVDPVDGFGRGR